MTVISLAINQEEDSVKEQQAKNTNFFDDIKPTVRPPGVSALPLDAIRM